MTGVLQRGIYLITEHERLTFTRLLAIAETVVPAGIAALQYRNKSANQEQRRMESAQLQQLCKQHDVPFIINDDPELAQELDADGIHLGREDGDCHKARLHIGPNRLIGISCYNELIRADSAVTQGANYIAFGAMFPTTTKTNTVAASTGLIREAKQRYTVPVVAIGGITPDNCEPVIDAGADLLAVISSVWLAKDPLHTITKFNQLMAK